MALSRSSVLDPEQVVGLIAPVVVLFLEGFVFADALLFLTELRRWSPMPALVIVTRLADRPAVWRAFEQCAVPPIVLTESAPPAVLLDAVTIARDVCLGEKLSQSSDVTVHDCGFETAVADIVEMLCKSEEPLGDQQFDRLLPMRLRAASARFWTPLPVIQRASEWLAELGVGTVVDVGSGAGKFCIVGALLTSCRFIGVEQRPKLCVVARNLTRFFRVDDRVSIIEGRFGMVETPLADCYYFYNPFEENLFPRQEALDDDAVLSKERFRSDLRAFHSLVASMPIGTYVISYNGIGGRLPECLDEIWADRDLPATLRLLQKVRRYSHLRVEPKGPESR
ncbi:MAG TPA: hypothetical protein VHB79_25160 [Polyangiaceae bacterium]|nr:hypothetical protein [Polyangiaceae bacterium]